MTTRLMVEDTEASAYAARYEALRQRAMARHRGEARLGLAVLLRQGVAAWMAAWSQIPVPVPRSAPPISPRPYSLPDGASADVVRLLAAMTLAHLEPVQV